MSQVSEQELDLDNLDESSSAAAPAVAETSENKAAKKVQLDLEDADFLNDIPEEPEYETPAVTESTGPSEEELLRQRRKKRIIIGSIVATILVILFAIGWYIFFSRPITEAPEEELPFIYVVKDYQDPEITPVYTTRLDPFWIEMKDEYGKTFFVVCNFALSTEDSFLAEEIDTHVPTIRDIIYYYLNTKDYDFLTKTYNFKVIKEDLLELVNAKLMTSKLSDILYENYMIR